MNKKPKISAVICTYNRASNLRDCLMSLAVQTLDPILFEVIIVNNNSTDNTLDIANKFISEFSNFRLVNEEKQGLSNARNRGITESEGDYIAYLDDDAKASPFWLEKALNIFLGMIPEPLAIGGVILPFYEYDKPKWFKDSYESRTWGSKTRYLNKGESFSGSNMIFKKKSLEQYKGFSTKYGITGENLMLGDETSLFLHMYEVENRDGIFFYSPSLVVYHLVPGYKTRPQYFMKRNFVAGKTSANIYRNQGLRHYIRIPYFIALFFVGLIVAPFTFFWTWNWSSWLAERIAPKFYYLGYLTQCVGLNINVKNK